MYFLVFFSLLSLKCVLTQDANCNFNINVGPTDRFSLETPNYPGSYPPGIVCRWIGNCPAGYNCRLDCELNLPESSGCTADRALISRSGDPQLTMAERYCGVRNVTNILSINSTIVLGVVIPGSSRGGRLRCVLSAQQAPTATGCQCGEHKQTRIVGGVATNEHEYPMMAGLFNEGTRRVFCGGVIIANSYVLTAAHCLDDLPRSTTIVVGNSNYTRGVRYGINSYIIHPNYDPSTLDYDIAILVTQTPIRYDANVGPACLPFKYYYDSLVGQDVTLLGWGLQSTGGIASQLLRKVDVQIISTQQCRQSLSNIDARKTCTFARGKDSCQMDSGGPGLYTDRSTGRLFALLIISEGQDCASPIPSINTNVTAFLNFILDNTRSSYCVVR